MGKVFIVLDYENGHEDIILHVFDSKEVTDKCLKYYSIYYPNNIIGYKEFDIETEYNEW